MGKMCWAYAIPKRRIPFVPGPLPAAADLKGKLNGLAVRVPLPNGSITDCVFEVKRSTSAEEVNALFKVCFSIYKVQAITYLPLALCFFATCSDANRCLVCVLYSLQAGGFRNVPQGHAWI
jgi:hypothetical protein